MIQPTVAPPTRSSSFDSASVSAEVAESPYRTPTSSTDGRPDARHTWLNQELELLISAAITFSLFQLPERIEAAFRHLEVHFGKDIFLWLILAYEMALLLVYGLIITFVSHFLLRSFWVGLLGLRSAFPGGIDWSRLKLGPVSESFYRQRLPTLRALEDQIDRAASSLFAFLFLFLIFVVQGLVMFAILAATATAVTWLLPVDDKTTVRNWIFVGLGGVAILASSLVMTVDKLLLSERWRGRVPGWARWLAEKLVVILSRISAFRLYLPVFFTLSARSSRGRMQAILIAFTYLLLGLFVLGVFLREGLLRVDSYVYFPVRIDEGELDPRHYDDLRAPGVPASVPTIPSDVIADDYLRLFVPFEPRRDNERVAALCPEIEPFRSDAAHLVSNRAAPASAEEIARLHACFDRLTEIELDGQPLTGAEWLFHTHPASGARGRITYLPTAGLAPGRHDLTIRRVKPPGEKDEGRIDRYFIPFWR